MPIFVSFVMGSKDAYFFNSPKHWAWRNLPPDVEALFTKQPPIQDVIEFALGEQGTYFVSYRDHDGKVYCRHYNLPDPLTQYLYCGHPHIIRDLTTLSLSLGPWQSYYAHDKTTASWSNLPPPLEKALEHRLISQDAWRTIWKEDGREAPSFVTLGADGSYFMRTVRGGGSWDLKAKEQEEGMKGINKFLEDATDFNGIAGLYLFPQQPASYVLLLTNSKSFSNLPEHTWEDYNKMAPSLPALVQTVSPIPCMPPTLPACPTTSMTARPLSQNNYQLHPQVQQQQRDINSGIQAHVPSRPAGAQYAGVGAVAGTLLGSIAGAAVRSYSANVVAANTGAVPVIGSDTTGSTAVASNDLMASSNNDSVNSFINGVFGGATYQTDNSGGGFGTANDMMAGSNAWAVDSAAYYSV